MELLDTLNLLQFCGEEVSVGTIVVPSSRETSWATLHSAEVLITTYFRPSVQPLEQAKTPVWRKLCVVNWKE